MFAGCACPGAPSTRPGSLSGCHSAPGIGLHLPLRQPPMKAPPHECSDSTWQARWQTGSQETWIQGVNTPPKHPGLPVEPWLALKHPSHFPSSENRKIVTSRYYFLGTPGPLVPGLTAIILVSEEMEALRFGTAAQGQTDTRVQSWDGAWVLSWLPTTP